MTSEMVHPLHLSDQHQAAVREFGNGTAMTVVMTRLDPPPLDRPGIQVDSYDPVIICSNELISQLRRGIEGVGGWVSDDGQLRIVADNADLTYGLELLGCGCWLGRLA